MTDTVYLIDTFSLMFQVFHGIPPMTSPAGLPTNAVFGFSRDLVTLLKDHKPTWLICAMESPGPGIRDAIYSAYKANRAEMPEDLRPQISMLKEVIQTFDIPLIEHAGWEADDVIATLTRQAVDRGYSVRIVTSDKDARQLLGPLVTIYNLRKKRAYRERRMVFEKTRPTPVSIGERRKPEPGGKPGYIRVDSVHQGDLDGKKGVYHINAVDEVTQWEVVGAVEHISEAWLQPRLEEMLAQFPFPILGFHTDNGSEYINKSVAAMLNKLKVEQTKSRPGHSSDNGLAETKNGGVIRKHMGFDHIASDHADSMNVFYTEHFNPYLNFHRPCGVPELKTDKRGKTKRVYKVYATPLEILLNLKEPRLKEGVTRKQLEKLAGAQSDTAPP